jgi:hypothetical protein
MMIRLSQILCAAFAAALVLPMLAMPNAARAEDNKPPEGFVALFDGKDLAGWKGLVADPPKRHKMSADELATAQKKADQVMRDHWSAQDGVLVFDGKKGGENICTAKDYGNFEMKVDWKILPKGDSGVYLRGSPQVQIWDTTELSYRKHGNEKGSGSLWNNEKHERFPLVFADKPLGEWNHFDIKMVGDQVTVDLNGKRVTDTVLENYWERDKPIYPKEQIELQNHGNPLYFKNIYIKELP